LDFNNSYIIGMNKFVIENDQFKISRCVEYHREMVRDNQKVQGGGLFVIEGEDLYLYGSSDEFGTASLEDVKRTLPDYGSWASHFNFYYSDCKNSIDIFKNPILLQSKIKR